MEYAMQQKAWMDESVMLSWVNTVLAPYLTTAPVGIRPMLVLDSYRCHMMASVVTSIRNLGCDVHHIPGGCTSLCQPLDIAINKPLKDGLRMHFQAWLRNKLAMLNNGVQLCNPTRHDVVRWTSDVMESITVQTVKNAWLKTDYSWF